MNEKKIDLKATAAAIKVKAGSNITDTEKFDEMMKDPEFVEEAAMLWGVKPIYE